MQEPMKITVDNWYAAIQDLSEGREYPDFNFTAFNFKNRKGTIIKYGVNRMQPQDLLGCNTSPGLNTEIKVSECYTPMHGILAKPSPERRYFL